VTPFNLRALLFQTCSFSRGRKGGRARQCLTHGGAVAGESVVPAGAPRGEEAPAGSSAPRRRAQLPVVLGRGSSAAAGSWFTTAATGGGESLSPGLLLRAALRWGEQCRRRRRRHGRGGARERARRRRSGGSPAPLTRAS
jgi:hypothetical protein